MQWKDSRSTNFRAQHAVIRLQLRQHFSKHAIINLYGKSRTNEHSGVFAIMFGGHMEEYPFWLHVCLSKLFKPARNCAIQTVKEINKTWYVQKGFRMMPINSSVT